MWCFHAGEEEHSTPRDAFIRNRIAAFEGRTEKLYVSAAAFLSRHPSVANYFTVELTVLKAITLELADLFGLTLLVSWKKQAHTTAGNQLVPEPHATTSLKERVETSS